MGIYKQTDTKHTQVHIEQASSAKNCSEGEMLRHFNALYYLKFIDTLKHIILVYLMLKYSLSTFEFRYSRNIITFEQSKNSFCLLFQ